MDSTPRLVSFLMWVAALLLAPLLPAVINRTKAFFVGRRGVPILQWYYEIAKLFRKGAVYSRTTTPLFRIGPVVSCAAVLAATVFVPFGGVGSLFSFEGDFLLVVYLLAAARFFTILAAMDTGSAFEGMGAGREAWFSILTEPAFFLGFLALSRGTGEFALTHIFLSINSGLWRSMALSLILCSGAFVAVYLTENSRIPIDDPTTHLELTMIHEVMVLDHGGPDLGLITYTGSLKLWVYGAILIGLLPLGSGNPWLAGGLFLLLQMGVGFGTGVIESIMARIKLFRISSFLTGACVFAAFAFFLSLG
jgi:formate hydrogenlyase subunit 4